jgi:hypothetical protein
MELSIFQPISVSPTRTPPPVTPITDIYIAPDDTPTIQLTAQETTIEITFESM